MFNNWMRLYKLCAKNIKNNNFIFNMDIRTISNKNGYFVLRTINLIIEDNNIYIDEKKKRSN